MRYKIEILARHAVPALLAAGRAMTLEWLMGVFKETLSDHGDPQVRRLARLTPFELTQGLVEISDQLAPFGLRVRFGHGTVQMMVNAPVESQAFCRRIARDRDASENAPEATEPQLEVAAALLFKGPMTPLELERTFDKDCGYLLGKLHALGWAERVTDAQDQSRWRITERFLNHFGWHSAEEARASLREDAARAEDPAKN